ncbi:hypothetical protein ElyMa_006683000 [Elysia marginata]|uniref:Uncharacterized protein n=1 Tax=Elysia marginata TaxID=1093978 RepID=A0AAV4IQ55_9GAST|nr:hypothetical protein ElyMa_006683000 [Elysia marginata]
MKTKQAKYYGAENISFSENHEESSSGHSVIFVRILMKNSSLVFLLVVGYMRIPEKWPCPYHFNRTFLVVALGSRTTRRVVKNVHRHFFLHACSMHRITCSV